MQSHVHRLRYRYTWNNVFQIRTLLQLFKARVAKHEMYYVFLKGSAYWLYKYGIGFKESEILDMLENYRDFVTNLGVMKREEFD